MLKDFKEDTWTKFNEEAQRKKIYIWGAGVKGREIIENHKKYASSWNIVGFVDNDPKKEMYLGYEVFHPDELKECLNECLILISTDKPGVIAQQIAEMGELENYYSYFWMNTNRRNFLLQKDVDTQKIEYVKSFLADRDSRAILDKIVMKREIGFMDYTDIQQDGNEYFDHDFFRYSKEEILVDGGGFDGDTIEEFVSFTKNCYSRIYSFEPDLKTGEILKSKLYRYGNKVQFYPYGLYNGSTNIPFCNDNVIYSSHIADCETANSSIRCVSLDDIVKGEKVSFIKMDIEGAEIPALYGAKNTILKYTPKLAICIYHKPTDLWEIPILIHSWVPDYKFYIRHYGAKYYSTILFATR